MKRIIALCSCLMLVFTTVTVVTSEEIENEFEENDFRFDVFHGIRLVRRNGKLLSSLFQSWNPIWQFFLKHLDIVSFSIFEDSDEPEFLQAKMKIRSFKYSERRTCYAIYWSYDNTCYFAGTNTHTSGENVSHIAGYFKQDNSCERFSIAGEINEEENTLSWIIPKDLIGNPEEGDLLKELRAGAYLIYNKDCDARVTLYLANDRAGPLNNECYTYAVQF